MAVYSTKEIQAGILELLKVFHKICTENNIQYSLHGGTLLGAIREHGFIPWDDDGDVTMFRDEYEKLAAILPRDNRANLYLDCELDKAKKLWLKQDGKPPVWIDIFVYDYISEKKLGQTMKLLILTMLTPTTKNETSIKYFRLHQRAKGMSKIIYEIIYFLCKPIPIKKRIKRYDAFCKKRFVGNRILVHRANDQLSGIPLILCAEKMRDYTNTRFEDTELMISTNYHEILSQIHGADYMTPENLPTTGIDVHNEIRNSQ